MRHKIQIISILFILIGNINILYSQRVMPITDNNTRVKKNISSMPPQQDATEIKVYGFNYAYTRKEQGLTKEEFKKYPDMYKQEKVVYITNLVEAYKEGKKYVKPNMWYTWQTVYKNYISSNIRLDTWTSGWYDYNTAVNNRNSKINEFVQKGFRVEYIDNFVYKQDLDPTYSEVKDEKKIERKKTEEKKLLLNTNSTAENSSNSKTKTSDATKTSETDEDFWNTPENKTTKQEIREREELKKQEALQQEKQKQEEALQNPYVLNGVSNGDTVYENNFQLIKSLNSTLGKAVVTTSWTDTKTRQTTTITGLDQKITLNKGWNEYTIDVWVNNTRKSNKVKLYYNPEKPNKTKILFFDDFNDGIISDSIQISGYKAEDHRTLYIENGILNHNQGGDYTFSNIMIKLNNIDVNKKLIVEFKSYQKRACEYYSDLKNNDEKETRCIARVFFNLPREKDDWKKNVKWEWFNIKMIFDLKNHTESLYINNSLVEHRGRFDQIKFDSNLRLFITSSESFNNWKIDDLLIYQE